MIQENNFNRQLLPKFSRTASTMVDTNLPSFFPKNPRKDRRLNSTIDFNQKITSKFNRLDLGSQTSVSWKKWRKNQFVVSCSSLKKVLRQKVEQREKE